MKPDTDTSILIVLSALLSAALIALGAAGVWLPGLPPELTWFGAAALLGGTGLLVALVVVVRRQRASRVGTRSSPKPAPGFDAKFARALDNINNLNQEISDTVARLERQEPAGARAFNAAVTVEEPPPGEGGGRTLH